MLVEIATSRKERNQEIFLSIEKPCVFQILYDMRVELGSFSLLSGRKLQLLTFQSLEADAVTSSNGLKLYLKHGLTDIAQSR